MVRAIFAASLKAGTTTAMRRPRNIRRILPNGSPTLKPLPSRIRHSGVAHRWSQLDSRLYLENGSTSSVGRGRPSDADPREWERSRGAAGRCAGTGSGGGVGVGVDGMGVGVGGARKREPVRLGAGAGL